MDKNKNNIKIKTGSQNYYVRPYALPLVLFILLSLSFIIDNSRMPQAKDSKAPNNDFSAVRAKSILRNILSPEIPHPIGSVQNKKIKQKLISYLKALGLNVQEQNEFICNSQFSFCGNIENVISEIPGKTQNPSILLMAHYDSVPTSPGAGDNGAAVATILETIRILKEEASFQNPIHILFTDGEEVGTLGARAFFDKTPYAKQVGIVINLEGCGSSGPSLLLRTSENNGLILDAYANTARKMAANSLFNEVFKYMPNYTDLSMALEKEKMCLEFAFVGERRNYHSPKDSINNLDIRTIQYHGDNTLNLIRYLADYKLDQYVKKSKLYINFFNFKLITCDKQHIVIWALIPLLILVLVFFRLRSIDWIDLKSVIKIASLSLLVVLAILIMGYLSLMLIKSIKNEIISWPASPYPYSIMIIGVSIFAGVGTIKLISRLTDYWSAIYGFWLIWGIISIITALFAPGIALVFILPLYFAIFSLAIMTWSFLRYKIFVRELFVILTISFLGYFLIDIALLVVSTQGFKLSLAIFLILTLIIIGLIPLSCTLPNNKSYLSFVLLSSFIFAFLSIIIIIITPLYSDQFPMRMNIHHVKDLDLKKSYWAIPFVSQIPEKLKQTGNFKTTKEMIFPWHKVKKYADGFRADLQYSQEFPPKLRKISENIYGRERTVTVGFTLRENTFLGEVLIPEESKIKQITVQNQTYPLKFNKWIKQKYKGYVPIRLAGFPQKEIQIQIQWNQTNPVEILVLEKKTGLPEEAKTMLSARSLNTMPINLGDLTIIAKRFVF